MNNIHVLDASAVLVYLQQEEGNDRVEAAMETAPCWMTTVNASEVMGKLCEKGMPAEEAQLAIDDLGLILIDFDRELARLAAALRPRTMAIGASLGDRACLALAQRSHGSGKVSVYTAEQGWARLSWPFELIVVRPARTVRSKRPLR